MGWKIENGQPVQTMLPNRFPPPEVRKPVFVTALTCPECGKEYKTESGYTKHLDTHK